MGYDSKYIIVNTGFARKKNMHFYAFLCIFMHKIAYDFDYQ